MQSKAINRKEKRTHKKLSLSKDERLNELIKDIKQARKDLRQGKLFKGTAREVIEHLKKLRNENNPL
jgi:hypothetical protein